MPIIPRSVAAQLIPNCERTYQKTNIDIRNIVLALVNIWTVNRGNAAATADRIMVLAANAEELYILKTNLMLASGVTCMP
jgi:hypothetical protein